MAFFKLVQERWLSIYTSSVLVAFGLGFAFKDQVQQGSFLSPAVWLILPWSALPDRLIPPPVREFLNSFHDLPMILTGMTLNIALIGFVQWVCSKIAPK